MTRLEVLLRFLNRAPAYCHNLQTEGDRLYSYGVLVAEWEGDCLRITEPIEGEPEAASRHRQELRLLAKDRKEAAR